MSEEALFEWSEDYKTGHEVIDREHESLFSLLQSLTDAANEGEDEKATIINALNQLLEHTQTLFRNEESLMLRRTTTTGKDIEQRTTLSMVR